MATSALKPTDINGKQAQETLLGVVQRAVTLENGVIVRHGSGWRRCIDIDNQQAHPSLGVSARREKTASA